MSYLDASMGFSLPLMRMLRAKDRKSWVKVPCCSAVA